MFINTPKYYNISKRINRITAAAINTNKAFAINFRIPTIIFPVKNVALSNILQIADRHEKITERISKIVIIIQTCLFNKSYYYII